MCSDKIYDVVCIGNFTKDTIITPSGTRYVDGGGMNYAAHAAAQLGFLVAVVTRLAQEDDRVVQRFSQAGIDCFPVYTPSSTLMCLNYPTENPDIRTLSVKATAGTITAAQVQDLKMKSAVIGSSLRGEVGMDVIRELKSRKVTVAADMQGFVRVLRSEQLVYEPWPEMKAILAQLDILKSDAVEAEFLTGEKDIFKAARFFADMGPKEIVLTHKDGLLILADGQFHELGFHPENLSGRSGRGDTCIGSYVAMRLKKPPLEAATWAAAVTSLKMEKMGLFDRPLAQVEAFIQTHYSHGSVHRKTK
jgi:sugar/nucleoside kinase (ribokinase family)